MLERWAGEEFDNIGTSIWFVFVFLLTSRLILDLFVKSTEEKFYHNEFIVPEKMKREERKKQHDLKMLDLDAQKIKKQNTLVNLRKGRY